MEWSIRSLMNPVITRLLIYGVNPIDVEFVLRAVEQENHTHAHSLEQCWYQEWEKKASVYQKLGREAEQRHNLLSAREFFFYAAQCYYAVFLINLSRIELKKEVYAKYAACYKQSLQSALTQSEYLEIPIDDRQSLAGYLHHPRTAGGEPGPCVVIFSGLGSCKEEMHTLAQPLLERGISVYIPDMPGSGESLFMRDIKCRIANLQHSFTKVLDVLGSRPEIRRDVIGVYGLCMGGGYAYHAAAADNRYAFCVNLFPLLVSQVAPGVTPQWMQQGKWYDYQTGNLPAEEFINEIRRLEEGTLECPYLFIHGAHDNWMTLDKANELFTRARGKKEKIIITEAPVFSGEHAVTHTMPVGEQLHWIRHVAADWIKALCC